MATGRELFARISPVLRTAAVLLAPIPARWVAGLWWTVASIPGKPGMGLRYVWAKRLCRACGDNVMIGPGVYVDHWQQLSFGNNVTVHRHCYLDARGGISIGNQVSIAHATSLVAFDHTWNDRSLPIKYNELKSAPISIDDDVWIGCGVRILSGAQIGSRTVVSAGAVVTRGRIAGGVFGGVPAKCLKEFIEDVVNAETPE